MEITMRAHCTVQTTKQETKTVLTAFLKGFSWFNGADPSPPASSATFCAAGGGRDDGEDVDDDDDSGVDDGAGVSCQTRMADTTPAVQTAVMTAVMRILSQPG